MFAPQALYHAVSTLLLGGSRYATGVYGMFLGFSRFLIPVIEPSVKRRVVSAPRDHPRRQAFDVGADVARACQPDTLPCAQDVLEGAP
jgi:hypothetical protein